MNIFTHHYLLANEKLLPLQDKIELILKEIEEVVLSKLKATSVDVVVQHCPYLTIPELGIVGRYVHEAKLIEITLDVDHEYLQQNLEKELKRTLAHEYMHAVREKYVPWNTLLDGIVEEGLTQHFEIEANPDFKPAMYAIHLSEDEIEDAWQTVQSELQSTDYDHNAWFFGNKEKKIKQWTGYSLGYWLVQQKMAKENKQVSEMVKLGSKDFLLH